MDRLPLQDPQHALRKLAEHIHRQVAEFQASLKRSPAGPPVQQSAASWAEISESSPAETVTQSISKLSIASSNASWEHHWSVEVPRTQSDGPWKSEHEVLTTTKDGHWAEWQQADVWTRWRENRDPSVGPTAENPGAQAVDQGEAANGARQQPFGSESSSSMNEVQMVAEAQVAPKKIALAEIAVRQALAMETVRQDALGLPSFAGDPTTLEIVSETVSDTESRHTKVAKKFSLEILVGVLNGDAKEIIRYTFGPGQDDYTMGNVMCHIKTLFPMSCNTRSKLSLCGCVLDDESEEMYMKIQAYLHRYCDDYNEDTAELQLHATLIFEPDWSQIYDRQGKHIGALLSWYICLGKTRDGTAANDWAMQDCCRIHASKDWILKYTSALRTPQPRWYCTCSKRYKSSWGQLVQLKWTNAAGQQEDFYMRAECPTWDIEDVRAAWAEQEYNADFDTPMDLYNKLQRYVPATRSLVIEDPMGENQLKVTSKADFEALPLLSWWELFGIIGVKPPKGCNPPKLLAMENGP